MYAFLDLPPELPVVTQRPYGTATVGERKSTCMGRVTPSKTVAASTRAWCSERSCSLPVSWRSRCALFSRIFTAYVSRSTTRLKRPKVEIF